MSKLFGAALIAVFVAVGVFQSSGAFAGQGIEITVSTALPPKTPVVLGLENLAKELNATGQFNATVYASAQLGSIVDMLDRCLDGDAVIATCDAADIADITFKDLSIIHAPFLFDSWEQIAAVMNSDWYQDVWGKVKDRGIVILGNNWIGGDRHYITRKPVTNLADLEGMKIRTPASIYFVKSQEVLGATPTPMAFGDVFTAMQQGVIDGAENPLADIYHSKIHEAGKYIVEESHMLQLSVIVTGTEFFDSLTKEQQDLLMQLVHESGEYEQTQFFKTNAEMKQLLEAEGVVFNHIDRTSFIKKAEKYYDLPDFKEWTPGLHQRILDILGK